MPEYVVTNVRTWLVHVAGGGAEAQDFVEHGYIMGRQPEALLDDPDTEDWQVEEVREGKWLGRLEPDESPDDVRTEEDA